MDRDTRDRARQRPGEAGRAAPDPQGYMLIGREAESQRHRDTCRDREPAHRESGV